MRKVLKALWEGLLKMERFIIIVSCIAVAMLVFATVIMRYIFKTDFNGMEELVMFFAFLIYFFGGAYGSYEDSQISADILTIFMKKERAKMRMRSFRCALESVIMGFSSYLAFNQILRAVKTGQKTMVLKIPFTITYSVIFIGLALMTMYAIYHTIDYGRHAFRPEKEGPEL